MDLILSTLGFIFDSAIDVLPIAAFLFAFQRLVIGEPLANGKKIAVGFVFVVIGLGLFLVGLEKTLFPLGKLMAQQLTNPAFLYEVAGKAVADLVWQDYYWVYIFALAIGFSTTLAEPALIAVSMKANTVSGGAIGVWGLRVAVAIGVGVRLSGPGEFIPFGRQFIGQTGHIGNAKGYVADAHLVKQYRLAVGVLSRREAVEEVAHFRILDRGLPVFTALCPKGLYVEDAWRNAVTLLEAAGEIGR